MYIVFSGDITLLPNSSSQSNPPTLKDADFDVINVVVPQTYELIKRFDNH